MDFVGYTRQCYYGTYRTNIATIVLPSTQVHCLGRILIFWLLPFTSKKNKGAVSHGYSRNHVKTYGQVLFSAIFPKSRLYIGRSCRTDPAPFLGFRQIPAYKSIVPLQGFEPCFVPRLSTIKDWALWLIPSDPHISGKNGGFFAALKQPPKENMATHKGWT